VYNSQNIKNLLQRRILYVNMIYIFISRRRAFSAAYKNGAGFQKNAKKALKIPKLAPCGINFRDVQYLHRERRRSDFKLKNKLHKQERTKWDF